MAWMWHQGQSQWQAAAGFSSSWHEPMAKSSCGMSYQMYSAHFGAFQAYQVLLCWAPVPSTVPEVNLNPSAEASIKLADFDKTASFVIFKQIFPGEFRSFATRLDQRAKEEDDENAATDICNIIGQFYDVIVRDCRSLSAVSEDSLYRYKVKNLAHALGELLEDSNSLKDMLETFSFEYGVSPTSSASEGDEVVGLPTIHTELLERFHHLYGWCDEPILRQLIRWCTSQFQLTSQVDIEMLISDIVSELCSLEGSNVHQEPPTPYSVLDCLMNRVL